MVDHDAPNGDSIDERASRLLAAMQGSAPPLPAAARRIARGWFQFGIGEVFFIVLVVAFWLAGETRAVRERQRLRQWAESIGGKISSHRMAIRSEASADGRSVCVPVEDLTNPPATTSFLQRLMRDEGVGAIVIYRDLTDDEATQLMSWLAVQVESWGLIL